MMMTFEVCLFISSRFLQNKVTFDESKGANRLKVEGQGISFGIDQSYWEFEECFT